MLFFPLLCQAGSKSGELVLEALESDLCLPFPLGLLGLEVPGLVCLAFKLFHGFWVQFLAPT